ncbi:rhodanese-like domain-containing protein [Streptomyces sp. NPDC059506]|uniref:rhodanese-like domain-containing protein n=1 Tax=unclassified Streptomyces TaxID=2593676 RepID=UPI0015FC39DD|nr:rhodanese-like domain-containing protein [Streptomyces sp. SCUT-3]QMV24274.1 DUF2892 domain-containing protein [Streptomyces sp. SCUT-3]
MTESLTAQELHARRGRLTVIDVRTPGEYAAGHVPGALNVPLEHLQRALPALRAAAGRGGLAVVCASGARSESACKALDEAGLDARSVTGGTDAWARAGFELERPAGARAVWPMERQVRLAAGSLVLAGLVAGRRRPAARWLSAGVGAGLVFSAVSNTCGMAALLSRLPHNRPADAAAELERTLAALRG